MVKVDDVQELSTTRSQIYIRFAAKKIKNFATGTIKQYVTHQWYWAPL